MLSDQRGCDVPTTTIACEFSTDLLREWIAQTHPYIAELMSAAERGSPSAMRGLWPRFSEVARLVGYTRRSGRENRYFTIGMSTPS